MFRKIWGAAALAGIGIGLAFVTGPGQPTAAEPAAPARLAIASTAAASPVVLELFTSQGCSSCPPADALAARLAARGDVIVISRPVTYWDRLGWRDTLAQPANTELQRAYAQRGLAGYNGVYTPQAVVNGRLGEVGSDASDVSRMIARAARAAAPRLVVARAGAAVMVTVTGPRIVGRGARLALVGMSAHESVVIGSGENGDRTLSYTNVYRGARDLGEWRGGEQVFALGTNPYVPGADTHALVLREGAAGPILAAARL